MNLIDVVTPENWHLHTMEDYVRDVNEERENLHSEIAGLRAKHNDYEHPQDSIDRGNRISQLEIDKYNLQTQLDALKSEISTCTECKQPVDCGLKAELRKKDAEIERLNEAWQIEHTERVKLEERVKMRDSKIEVLKDELESLRLEP